MIDREDTMQTTIPTYPEIKAMNAGVRSGSAYHNARHEVWLAIYNAHRNPHRVSDDALEDAIEWAQILDRSVPAQQGSWLEIADFRRHALDALTPA